MTKLTKGPQSLTSVIGEELKADAPEWDKIAPQTKEYVEMAGTMAKYDPPKGSKESWAKYTTSFTASAAALEKAASAKDKDGAIAAHKSLSASCMACHQKHRGGPGGFGPMGGKGFGPPGKDGGFGPPPGKGGPPPGSGGGEPPAKDE
jgi:mono/diheme cytochrome c family protein